jgi:hypothetical protein
MSTETMDRARAEFYAAKRAARETRRAFASSGASPFVAVMQGVIGQYLQARLDGVSREDGIRGIDAELRGAWPKSVSKFKPACDACDDTGYQEHTCWESQRCGREVCAKNPDRQHLYVEPCHCPKGDRFRPKFRSSDDDLASVGRMKKKTRGWRGIGS